MEIFAEGGGENKLFLDTWKWCLFGLFLVGLPILLPSIPLVSACPDSGTGLGMDDPLGAESANCSGVPLRCAPIGTCSSIQSVGL